MQLSVIGVYLGIITLVSMSFFIVSVGKVAKN